LKELVPKLIKRWGKEIKVNVNELAIMKMKTKVGEPVILGRGEFG
jgi:predicted metal-dependent hydrolase